MDTRNDKSIRERGLELALGELDSFNRSGSNPWYPEIEKVIARADSFANYILNGQNNAKAA